MIPVFTDGSSAKNGNGGWAFVTEVDGEIVEKSGSQKDTTNNQMELKAVLETLRYFPPDTPLRIVSDSQYVIYGITEWVRGWIRSGWIGSNGRPVQNREYWELLLRLTKGRQIEWDWVKGHNGHPLNERADRLAHAACRGLDPDSLFRATHYGPFGNVKLIADQRMFIIVGQAQEAAVLIEDSQGTRAAVLEYEFKKSFKKLKRGRK